MSNNQDQIGFEQLGLGATLKRYRLVVPSNQRDFAWTTKEVSAFLEDLSLAILDDENQHFFGSLVTIPVNEGKLEVVDGQQRLATAALTLAAMRHIVDDEAGNLSKALDSYLSDVDTATLEMSPKMRLNAADTQVFHDLILSGDASKSAFKSRDSHKLLIQAYETASSHMHDVAKPVSSNERVKIFQKWMNYIEYNAKVILLVVPNNANAYKMFETLNDRGLKVSQSDLVKNYIFGQAGPDGLEQAQQTWSYVKGSLETLDENDITITFLRQALISMHGPVRQTQVYEKAQSIAKGSQSSLQFLAELENLANDYVAIVNPSSEKWNSYPPKVRKSLEVLNLFDIKPFRPVFMSIARNFKPKEANEAFHQMVSYGIRILITSGTRSGSIEQQCGKTAKQIHDKEITTAAGLRKALSSIIPNDQEFSDAFETASVSQAKFARYYLRSLERAASKQQQPWLIPNDDQNVVNLEHVLPTKRLDGWKNFSDEEHKAFRNRIGNLALLSAKDNSDLKSEEFADKKSALSSSPFETTSMIAEKENWGKDQIVERQKFLAKLALKAWPHKG